MKPENRFFGIFNIWNVTHLQNIWREWQQKDGVLRGGNWE